jgi:hypothetical protein
MLVPLFKQLARCLTSAHFQVRPPARGGRALEGGQQRVGAGAGMGRPRAAAAPWSASGGAKVGPRLRRRT